MSSLTIGKVGRRCPFRRHDFLSAVLSFLVVSLALPPAVVRAGELDRHIELLDQATVRRISLEFDQTPFHRAVHEIGEAAGITVIVDRREMEETGFDPDKPIRMIFRETPAGTALQMLCDVLGEGLGGFRLEAYGGLLRVTSSLVADRHRYVRRYEVRDLLADAGTFERLSQRRLDGEPDADADARAEFAGNRDELLRYLIGTVQHLVHPDEWSEMGGKRAELGIFAGGIYVVASASTHQLVRNMLDEMRRARPSDLVFEIAFVELERSAFAEAQARHPVGTRSLARALVRGGSVWYRSFGTVSEGGTFRTEHTAGEERIGVAFSPRLDRYRGILSCMVGAQVIGPGWGRSVDTDVDLAPDHQSIVVEIPGDSSSDRGLFLIIALVQTR